jgi:two-component system, cell cycle response regulator
VLRELAQRSRNSVRSYDMVGRFGGEEFLVILNKRHPSCAVARAENIRLSVAKKPFPTRTKPLPVTVSVGVALSTDFEALSADEILGKADTALYEAKGSGRNCVRIAHPAPANPQTDEAPPIEPARLTTS